MQEERKPATVQDVLPYQMDIQGTRPTSSSILGFSRQRFDPVNIAGELNATSSKATFKLSGRDTWIDPSSVFLNAKVSFNHTQAGGADKDMVIECPNTCLFREMVTRMGGGNEADRTQNIHLLKSFLGKSSSSADAQTKHMNALINHERSLVTASATTATAYNVYADMSWQQNAVGIFQTQQYLNLRHNMEIDYQLCTLDEVKKFVNYFRCDDATASTTQANKDVSVLNSFKMENVYLSCNVMHLHPQFSKMYNFFLDSVANGVNNYHEILIDGWDYQSNALANSTGSQSISLNMVKEDLKSVYSLIYEESATSNTNKWKSTPSNLNGFQYVLNSQPFPAYSACVGVTANESNLCECYVLMCEAFGYNNKNWVSSLSYDEFKDNYFSICQNFESAVGVAFHTGKPVNNTLKLNLSFPTTAPGGSKSIVTFGLYQKVLKVYANTVVIKQ